MKRRLAFLQPEIPHYRKDFFNLVRQGCEVCDLFVYNSIEQAEKQGFCVDSSGVEYLPNYSNKGYLFFNPFRLLKRRYDVLVLMLHIGHIATWLLLFTKWLHRKKLILWGHGISVKRYLVEEKKPDWRLKLMIALSDGVMLYTEKELAQWKKIFPKKPIVALNNTLSGVKEIVDYVAPDRTTLKEKYGIKQPKLLLFCARFRGNIRRTDLLLETIKRLDPEQFGFIIIGAGQSKPDFSVFPNVYDFGAVYDTATKQELFSIADIYFQPGWLGLSIVEAMAYGKPIFTFVRSEKTLQCVEYEYVKDQENGRIFTTLDNCLDVISNISIDEIQRMGGNAKTLVEEKFLPSHMSEKALTLIENI